MKKMSYWLLTGVSILFLVSCASTSHIPAVGSFDVERYAGVWYEIARLPNSYEKNLTNVCAWYRLDSEGGVDVHNYGFNPKKMSWSRIKGYAYFAKSKDLGELKVVFYWPFRASYRIIELGGDYDHAMVTSGSMSYLWILSRTPSMDQKRLDALLAKAKAWGFATDQLIMVDQSMNKAVQEENSKKSAASADGEPPLSQEASAPAEKPVEKAGDAAETTKNDAATGTKSEPGA